jgi:antitoxin (DNA-binding transcriptional repressor) of toxin-antitoxin stability system
MGTANAATLGASNHGGVTVRIASSNPAVALVSPNASTVGTAFFDAVVANGSTQVSFVVHGVEGVTGSVTVTASAPGFTDGAGTATIVPPALRLVNLAATTTALSANDDFLVQIGLPNAGNASLSLLQAVRAGSAVTATVSNSAATVGQLTTSAGSAQTRTVVIVAGQSASPASLAAGGVQFDPLAGGTTQVSGSIPGFITTTAGNVTVTVTP